MIRKKINKDNVLDFLKGNLNFFLENPEILEFLNFPSPHKWLGVKTKEARNVVSFKDWVIDSLKKKQNQIIKTAKINFFTQKKVNKVVLNLIKINELDEFTYFLNNKLCKELGIECICLVSSYRNIKLYGGIYMENSKLERIYKPSNLIIMDAVDEKLGLFNSFPEKIYSNAIYSLDYKIFNSITLIALGSKDKLFIGNKGTELIEFFSQVFQECLKRLCQKYGK